MAQKARRAKWKRIDIKRGLIVEREALEQLSTTVLAVLCQRVMEDPDVDEATAEQALHLKREWIMLQVPQPPDFKEHKDNLAKLDVLKDRMVQFLSGRDIL